jgi:hypothetical protein
MIFTEPICIRCKHYNLEEGTCKAFPKEIPDDIYMGDNDHSKPFPGQKNDIVFEPIEK